LNSVNVKTCILTGLNIDMYLTGLNFCETHNVFFTNATNIHLADLHGIFSALELFHVGQVQRFHGLVKLLQ
jgi:hypothetical protein